MRNAWIEDMGSSSGGSQTIGYWYHLLVHFGLCRGPIDAFLAFRGGDKDAWTGELTNSGQIYINALNLWGGEKSEGGIQGYVDVMFGEQSQQPNSYLAANLGAQQSAYRGRTSVVFRGGKYGAFNPYPKPASFKIRRIFRGWDNDACWYPEKASVKIIDSNDYSVLVASRIYIAIDVSAGMANRLNSIKTATLLVIDYLQNSASFGSDPISIMLCAYSTGVSRIERNNITGDGFNDLRAFVSGLVAGGAANAFSAYFSANGFFAGKTDQRNTIICVSGNTMGNIVEAQGFLNFILSSVRDSGRSISVFGIGVDTPGSLNQFPNDNAPVPVVSSNDPQRIADAIVNVLQSSSMAHNYMNPAHVLYDSITATEMDGQPVSSINDASFRAAADKLFDEGFAVCTKYDAANESIEDFQQRICNVIGGRLSRSRVDGQWYLDLIRGDYDIGTLPILTDDDILSFTEEPSTLDGAVSQVVIKWFDPERKENRSTAPQQSIGAIQAFGGVISETIDYPEIPIESLALRVGARDLIAKSTPLRRFELRTTRMTYSWRSGQYFRLRMPRRGIEDMVCMVGDCDSGTLRSGAISLQAIQDVYGMPSTTYVVGEPGINVTPPRSPSVVEYQRCFEVPYVDLAGRLPAADLSSLPADAGYLAAVAVQPASGLNYNLWTAVADAPYTDVGVADWCPAATVSASAGYLQTEFPVGSDSGMDRITIGTAALWDDEIVRVDSIDVTRRVISVGRGCADSVPSHHASGSRIYFYDAWSGYDTTEYVDGEAVTAKCLTNTSTQRLPIDLADPISVIMASRVFRPYPPGNLQINGERYPSSFIETVTATWSHRDRILQADQLVDTLSGDIGPEAGVSYTVRWYVRGELVQSRSDLNITSDTFTAPTDSEDYPVRIEIDSVRDGMVSLQSLSHTLTCIGRQIVTEENNEIISEDQRIITPE